MHGTLEDHKQGLTPVGQAELMQRHPACSCSSTCVKSVLLPGADKPDEAQAEMSLTVQCLW